MTVLEPFCLHTESLCHPKDSPMEICNIRLTVLDTQRFPKNFSRPYCLISLNDVAVAKTACLEGSLTAWDEDFVFGGLNREICTLDVMILNKHKRVKDSVVGKVTLDLAQLPNRTTTEEWYELKAVEKGSGKGKPSPLGTLRLRVKYQRDVVLPHGEYEPLRDLLIANNMEAIMCLGEVIKDRRSLIGSLIKIFSDCPAGIRILLGNLAEKEVKVHDNPATLFRSNSVASTAVDEYMKLVAMPFLHATLKSIVNEIVTTNPHCELDPNRLEKGEDVEHNQTTLLKYMSQMLSSIFASADKIDGALREVFCTLQGLVKRRYPDNEQVRTRVVAGFFFLRFICLALVNPRLFNLVTNQPSERASRNLTLIAKGLQTLASLVEFGAKEPYMVGVNQFINSHRQGMIDFVDKISVEQENSLQVCTIDISGVVHREFANLASITAEYLPEMKKLSESSKPNASTFTELVLTLDRLQVSN